MRNYNLPGALRLQQPDWTQRQNSSQLANVPNLPLEIMQLIFELCSVPDLLNCRLASRGFDQFITQQTQLLYKIALAYEKQVDACSSGQLPTSAKLRLLHQQGIAWRGEKTSGMRTSIPITRSDSIYELNCGHFALGDVNQATTQLHFLRLPSVLAGRTEPLWSQVDSSVPIVDFTMDHDLDLLVLIEQQPPFSSMQQTRPYRIHLRSLSTNQPHPLCKVPILEYPCHPDWWEYQLVVSIFEDHLGLLFCSGRPGTCGYDRIAIWNWKTGALLAAMHAEEEVFDSFLFLHEGALLLPSISTNSLKVIAYGAQPNGGTYSYVVGSFLLPAVQAGLAYIYILARSQPTASFQPRNSDTPFAPDIHEGIIVLSLRIGFTDPQSENDIPDQDSTLILRRSTIRKYLRHSMEKHEIFFPSASPSSSPSYIRPIFPTPATIPWAVWGGGTRWLRDMASPRWVRDVHGTRFAARVSTPEGPKTRIYDFNSLPYQRKHQGKKDKGWSIIREEEGGQWTRMPVWKETSIKPGTTFAEEVCTGLPYLEITSRESVKYTGLMIDAERVVGMQTDEAGNLTSLEVLVL